MEKSTLIKKRDSDRLANRRKIVRESQRRRRERAKEKGMCIICCIRLPEDGYKTCRECIERVKNYEN